METSSESDLNDEYDNWVLGIIMGGVTPFEHTPLGSSSHSAAGSQGSHGLCDRLGHFGRHGRRRR
jgi:hypothetical protein